MKLVLKFGVLCMALVAGAPAKAVEPLALYDDFNAKSIDASNWSGQISGSHLDVAREIHGNRLRLAARAFGNPTASGSAASRLRLAFVAPAAVEAIDATVEVRKVEATGCPVNTATPTRSAMRLSGFFFKSAAAPGSGGVNDVLAVARIERSTAFDDPPGLMRVQGVVFHCTNPDCSSAIALSTSDLGTIEEGQKVRLRIQWDKLGHQFIFQRDDQPEVFAPYLVPDVLAPVIQSKRIEIAHDVASCTVAGPSAFMEAFVNDVFVNASAVPVP
jgi:hypothetical protein